MYPQPHATTTTTRPTATRRDLATEYAKRIAAYQPTAPVSDRRKRRTGVTPNVNAEQWCEAYKPLSHREIEALRRMATIEAQKPQVQAVVVAKPVIVDRPNIGGTKHANACNGQSGNYRDRSVSAGAKGKQTYLHGLPPHAVGM